MFYLEGGDALSPHQAKKLLTQLQQLDSSLTSFSAKRVYWVDAPEIDVPLLAEILEAEVADYGSNSQGCWFLPRQGASSPWSSKATDIFKQCGFSQLQHVEAGTYFQFQLAGELVPELTAVCYDRMTQACVTNPALFATWFAHPEAKSFSTYPLLTGNELVLRTISDELGLALQDADYQHLLGVYQRMGRDPSGAELMMFAQVNSEHCRHKVFNSNWRVNGVEQDATLFSMIRHTYKTHPGRVVVAYSDNAAVIETGSVARWMPDDDHCYRLSDDPSGLVLKVETHNHPTGISPHPGAATGSGGEIRDEAATGCGAAAKMGMVGFAVSNLQIPAATHAWEHPYATPDHLATALEIMLEAPMGGAAYNNEFGRPALCGFFRTLGMPFANSDALWGFHKPLMIAGGVGQIRLMNAHKKAVQPGDALMVLGGPGMLIGLGGGALSSQQLTSGSQDLDFASVQRANPEMQRRAQEVIQACYALGEDNPIISIHDVGAGGLCNALPELVEADDLGAEIDLRSVPVAESGMSPMEIWCNESQERYVLAVRPESVAQLQAFAERERAPLAVVGQATQEPQLRVYDSLFDTYPVDMRMADLFDCNQALQRSDESVQHVYAPINWERYDLAESVELVLGHPAVADKSFLISIGDRSVGGLVARDQFVGPWQIPVADVAVTAAGFHASSGEAMAVGERPPVAILDSVAAAGLAVGEAITNLAAAHVGSLSHAALSANWMSAVDVPGEGAALYQAVQALGKEICPTLQISIPVGKDSLSMRSHWEGGDVISPQALVVTAAGPVVDITQTWTPQLRQEKSALLLIDLSAGQYALGASIFAQVRTEMGQEPARLHSAQQLKQFFQAMQALHAADLVLAYHDRSDGGLLATVAEMMFAGHLGVDLHLPESVAINEFLFHEGLGAVIQVAESQLDTVLTILDGHQLQDAVYPLGGVNDVDALRIYRSDESVCYERSRVELGRVWSKTSYEMQKLRDNPETAQAEYDRWLDADDPGLGEFTPASLRTDAATSPSLRADAVGAAIQGENGLLRRASSPPRNDEGGESHKDEGGQPRVAILREQGVNGQAEMAAAFAQAGFTVVDVHMDDLLSGKQTLDSFVGLAACGGFSYGDVLGAGRGWAQVILNHAELKEQFRVFFADKRKFALGVCNGCQMLSQLKAIIPGADRWPRFVHNQSGRFESRMCLVKVNESPSIFLRNMEDSVISVVAAHGEGLVQTAPASACLSYVDNRHEPTETYPANPNGSAGGQTAFCNDDGRILIMMPHPERVFLQQQQTWRSDTAMGDSPWGQFFRNAREFIAAG